ncbi:efflux RND transporter periplasmic adaptor subunit [Campylobacter sp. CCUG 57310]|uniref:efflux RND transporter periplasmic adaptor subunit n=1 Tax=Campylobacter sp. CCUG 57310 TaxID=2517362 RepID=UPI001564A778|nr:efflux RND transporter periplasmic adaptor subunit [Campylobacter sp. CCUG 57310]QKF92061.1 macrolide-specific efflux protein, membrane fusion protein MacA [Campylobacter sp. CCUG 57310]
MKNFIKFVVITAIIAACGYFVYEKYFKEEKKDEFITSVAVRGDLAKSIDSNGEIYANELIDVGAQVSGQIKKLYVKLGDRVKAGDMIAEIDSATQQNNVDTKKAQLGIYEAKLNSAKVALEIAESKFKREKELFSKNATSKEEFENAKNSLAVTKANIKEIEAQITQTKISLNTAQIDLGYTKIVAPKEGTIVSVQVEEGQTVNSNQTTPTIVNIADLTKLKLKMEIAEGDITKIKVGSKVEYSILSEPNKKFQTQISSIDPGLTTLSNGKYSQTSTSANSSSSSSAIYYYANAVIDNKDEILRIGMTTQNIITLENVKDAIIIPSIAIKKEGGKNYVSVLKGDNSVEKREVVVGLTDNLKSQIINGVSEGEKVITSRSSAAELDQMIERENRRMRGR